MYSRSYEYIHTYYKSANKREGWNSNCVDVQVYVHIYLCKHCVFFSVHNSYFLTGFSFRFSLLKNATYLFCFTWHGNDGPMYVCMYIHVWMYMYIKVTLTHKQKLTYTNGCVCVQQVKRERERESECMVAQWWAQHSCWNLAVNGGE